MGKQATAEKGSQKSQQAQSQQAQSQQAQSQQAQLPSAANKTKDTLQVITAALPIIGASGTLFVWITANFYVGDVEIACADKYDHMLVKVFDNKGHETQFHTPRFQVWPGSYHFEISADDGKPQHADANVEFHQKTTIPVTLAAAPKADPQSDSHPVDPNADAKEEQSDSKKRSWWKFWRK